MRAWCLLAVLLPAAAHADVVVLADGQRIEGIVVSDGEEVVVRLDIGEVGFPRSAVVAIEPSHTALAELERALGAAKLDDPKVVFAFAEKARAAQLRSRARALYLRTIELDPNHAGARAALGHERIDGVWRWGDALRRHRGLVERGGEWLPAEEAKARDAAIERRREAREREAARQAEREAAKAAPPPIHVEQTTIWVGGSYPALGGYPGLGGWWPARPPPPRPLPGFTPAPVPGFRR